MVQSAQEKDSETTYAVHTKALETTPKVEAVGQMTDEERCSDSSQIAIGQTTMAEEWPDSGRTTDKWTRPDSNNQPKDSGRQ